MKYDETYYLKRTTDGEEVCDAVRKTKTYMSAPVWPKTSVLLGPCFKFFFSNKHSRIA